MGVYRALLIGIDAYKNARGLYGCANDVDLMSAVLEEFAPRPRQIHKLVAPCIEHRALRSDESLATCENIWNALRALTHSEPGDRVLVYYAGHGLCQNLPPSFQQRRAWLGCGAIFQDELLWDVQLRDCLEQIAASCGDLTVIIDSCFAAGTPRSDEKSRQLDLSQQKTARLHPPSVSDSLPAHYDLLDDSLPRSYTIAAAADTHSRAEEQHWDEKMYGVFTYLLVQVLRESCATDPTRLARLRWADIWPQIFKRVRERAKQKSSDQKPALLGPGHNRILGGSPGVPVGTIGIEAVGAGRYRLHAGSLCGLDVGARLAVYDTLPLRLPLPGAPLDPGCVCLGEVLIVQAGAFDADAEGPELHLPPSACARLIATAPEGSLQVGLDPQLPLALAAALSASAAEDGICYSHIERHAAEAYLGYEARSDSVWLGDRLYGSPARADGLALGPLWTALSSTAQQKEIRAVLCHYRDYVRALRIARRQTSDINSRGLAFSVCRCLPDELAQYRRAPSRAFWNERRIHPDPDGRVRVAHKAPLVFVVDGDPHQPCNWVLFCCNTSGTIKRMGASEPSSLAAAQHCVIAGFDKRRREAPLEPQLPDGRSVCIDRFILLFAMLPDLPQRLQTLELASSFAATARNKKGVPVPSTPFVTRYLEVVVGDSPYREGAPHAEP